MKEPFKRGQRLIFSYNGSPPVEVEYVMWWGMKRPSLIVIRFWYGTEKTVHLKNVRAASS